ncbi:hypothetical protein N7532_003490 [Penicillium argentinense]|uniref:Uncharacterized protein n=1 Tax=Penicillium argentinense TaxID=1131581 RepID=A0A9W9KEK6_9EURO|nr:uncharacterized protein N7532_003490 [Penicillium argentinense]KAJ5102961.1 hypothetical protein N7532_003490 [Penicillium argentinense]
MTGSGLWLAPMKNLHMTTLEIMSARREAEVDEVATFLQTKAPLRGIVDYTLAHRARLIRPIVSFDASAIALGFLPAEEGYSYHHLRRDLYDVVSHAGCQIGARYTVPSAHVTIARFVVPVGEGRRAEIAELLSQRVARVIDKIEDINCVLRSDDWERFGSPARGEWVVGQEKGLELIKGRSWYGEGDRVVIGEGF